MVGTNQDCKDGELTVIPVEHNLVVVYEIYVTPWIAKEGTPSFAGTHEFLSQLQRGGGQSGGYLGP